MTLEFVASPFMYLTHVFTSSCLHNIIVFNHWRYYERSNWFGNIKAGNHLHNCASEDEGTWKVALLYLLNIQQTFMF